jgi:hypothetical protein
MPLFDRKDKSRYATFTRRSLMMTGGMSAVFAVLGGRLYQLQIENGDQYRTQAEANRVSQRLIAPPRGRIVDRFGVELANNRRNYRVLLIAEQATDGVEAALERIAKVIEFPDRQKQKVLRDIAQNKKFLPVPVAENLSWEEFARLNLHLPYLARRYRTFWGTSHLSRRTTRRAPTIRCSICPASVSASAVSKSSSRTMFAALPVRAATKSMRMGVSFASFRACRDGPARTSGSPSISSSSSSSISAWARKARPAS